MRGPFTPRLLRLHHGLSGDEMKTIQKLQNEPTNDEKADRTHIELRSVMERFCFFFKSATTRRNCLLGDLG